LVQAFHSFKKVTLDFNLKKILLRVILPYLVVQSIALIFLFCKDPSGIYCFVGSGGAGPGSYYPWIYIQIALLLPFVKNLIEKGTTTLSAPTREALAEMVGNLPAECKYMVGAVGRTQDGSTYTLQVDIIKN
jgi:hypothetical protein